MAEAARLLNVSEASVRRWIDANEPTPEHPERVPVAERSRADGGPVKGRHRRPYADAVEAEVRRRRGQGVAGAGEPAGDQLGPDIPAGVTLS
jgi:DNA-binding transcriptional regulator YdaS (Cro superfamily)